MKSNLTALATYFLTLSAALALPRIITPPTDQSVSLSANVTELVSASGLAYLPVALQRRGDCGRNQPHSHCDLRPIA